MNSFLNFFRKNRRIVLFSVLFLSIISATAIYASSSEPRFRLIVNQEECILCGECEAVAPDCFIMEDGVVYVVFGWENYSEQFIEAIVSCPVQAIKLCYF